MNILFLAWWMIGCVMEADKAGGVEHASTHELIVLAIYGLVAPAAWLVRWIAYNIK